MNKTLEKVKKLRPIDDVFFEKIIEDKAVCEEIPSYCPPASS